MHTAYYLLIIFFNFNLIAGVIKEIILIDTHERSSLADYLLICEGRSQLHCRGIAENIEYNLKQEGELSLGMEGEREGNWVLLDYGNIILHIFHPEIRRYYRLEELYEQRPDEKNTQNLSLPNKK